MGWSHACTPFTPLLRFLNSGTLLAGVTSLLTAIMSIGAGLPSIVAACGAERFQMRVGGFGCDMSIICMQWCLVEGLHHLHAGIVPVLQPDDPT
jgi:hypothetical protein